MKATYNTIDWEQRRYELAKSAMNGILSDENEVGYACSEVKYGESEKNTTPKAVAQYAWLLSEFEKGNYNLLLDIMGIEKIPNPISFKLDSEDDMRMLKNAFGKQAID